MIVLVALLLALLPASAAAAPSAENQARLDGTIRYLQEVQNPNGGFGSDSGRESGQGFSAWVALALAAAGINPQDQAMPGGADAYRFLVDHFREGLREEASYPRVPTTAFERELMVVNASGTDPHAFAGYDLVAEILARERPDGSYPYLPGGRGEINDTVFAIVALSPVKEPAARAAVQRAADWVIGQQGSDGGWAWSVKGDRTEADLTGAVIQALNAAGRHGTGAERRALEYLRRMQNTDGGFPEFPGEGESNVASTAWAVQGIWSGGGDPEAWLVGGREPLDYLASLQQSDGHIRWKASQDLNGVWMTAYVAPAFAGQAWPIPTAPRSVERQQPEEPGQGDGSGSGEGVIAGGGGRGAPLFSQPKPQSKGRTPGGSRVVDGGNRHPRNHSDTRRAAHPASPGATAAAEPATAEEATAGSGSDGTAPSGRAGAGEGEVETAGLGAAGRAGGGSGREVTGTVVGRASSATTGAAIAYGAPGLHSAGAGGFPGVALAIGLAALASCLVGTWLERGRRVALP